MTLREAAPQEKASFAKGVNKIDRRVSVSIACGGRLNRVEGLEQIQASSRKNNQMVTLQAPLASPSRNGSQVARFVKEKAGQKTYLLDAPRVEETLAGQPGAFLLTHFRASLRVNKSLRECVNICCVIVFSRTEIPRRAGPANPGFGLRQFGQPASFPCCLALMPSRRDGATRPHFQFRRLWDCVGQL